MKENSKMQKLIIDNVLQHQFGSENNKIYHKKELKKTRGIKKKRPAESDVLDLETDLEGVISDNENINDNNNFITVEKKQIRISNSKFLNSETQSEAKLGKGRSKKSWKKKFNI